MPQPERHRLALRTAARDGDTDATVVVDSEHIAASAPVPDEVELNGNVDSVEAKWQRQLHDDRIP
jgi:hypothetical protein